MRFALVLGLGVGFAVTGCHHDPVPAHPQPGELPPLPPASGTPIGYLIDSATDLKLRDDQLKRFLERVELKPSTKNSITEVPALLRELAEVRRTGLAYDEQSDTLYVASTDDNAIFAIPAASQRTSPVKMGNLVFADSHLRGPLALRFAPNGNLLTANGDAVNSDVLHPSEIVEFTKWGQFVREYNVDAAQGGAFGIDAVRDAVAGFNYAVIDDVTNSLSVAELSLE